jgi:hypothetical protein
LIGAQQNGGNMNSHRKNMESGLGNKSLLKAYDNGLLMSTFNIEKKLEKLSKPVMIEIQAPENNYE